MKVSLWLKRPHQHGLGLRFCQYSQGEQNLRIA
jgi:hypothetical protein